MFIMGAGAETIVMLRASREVIYAGAPLTLTVEVLEGAHPLASVSIVVSTSWGALTGVDANRGAGRSVSLRTDARGVCRALWHAPSSSALTPRQAAALTSHLASLDPLGRGLAADMHRLAVLYRLDTHSALRHAIDAIVGDLDRDAADRRVLDVAIAAHVAHGASAASAVRTIHVINWAATFRHSLEAVIEIAAGGRSVLRGLEADGLKGAPLASLAMDRLDRLVMQERGSLGRRLAEQHVQRTVQRYMHTEVVGKPVEDRLALRATLGPAGALGASPLTMFSASVAIGGAVRRPELGRELDLAITGFREQLSRAALDAVTGARQDMETRRDATLADFASSVASRLTAAAAEAQTRFDAAGRASLDALDRDLAAMSRTLTDQARTDLASEITHANAALRRGIETELNLLSGRVRETVQRTITEFTGDMQQRVERLERTAVTTDSLNQALVPLTRDVRAIQERQSGFEQNVGRDFTDVRAQLNTKADARRVDTLEQSMQASLARKLDVAAFTPFEQNVNAQLQTQRSQLATISARPTPRPGP